MMETLMDTLTDNNFSVWEHTYDVITYAKGTVVTGTTEFSLLLKEDVVLHEHYNGNGTLTFSERLPLKSNTDLSNIIRKIK